MKVLITGGAGYIGSTTAKALEDAGHVPVTLDSLLTGPHAFARDRIFHKGDVAESAASRSRFPRSTSRTSVACSSATGCCSASRSSTRASRVRPSRSAGCASLRAEARSASSQGASEHRDDSDERCLLNLHNGISRRVKAP
jgi:hypothetical protein